MHLCSKTKLESYEQKAANARQRALCSADPFIRSTLLRLEQSWARLAFSVRCADQGLTNCGSEVPDGTSRGELPKPTLAIDAGVALNRP